MTDIQWGDPIEVNGIRPKWLKDGTPMTRRDRDAADNGRDGWLAQSCSTCRPERMSWKPWLTHIRLPADSTVYVALKHGFEPWCGGDAAPDDWDGGDVLGYDPSEVNPEYHYQLRRSGNVKQCWQRNNHFVDIIGYRKRSGPNPCPIDAQKHGHPLPGTPETITVSRDEYERLVNGYDRLLQIQDTWGKLKGLITVGASQGNPDYFHLGAEAEA